MYKSEGVRVSTDNVLMIYQIVHGLNNQAQDTFYTEITMSPRLFVLMFHIL